MDKVEPMNRLLEGDVGSGKTVVAAMAMYNTALNGYQAVLMAPTEILAAQHFESLKNMLGQKASVCLLTRSQFQISNFKFQNKFKNQISKKQVIESINSGEMKIVVGTHALLTENVEFKNLGLVIVDEQHRFGVEQRKMLKEKTARDLTPALSYKERETAIEARCVPAEKMTELITSDKIVIVDPPRAGLHENVVARFLSEKPERIIYLSCNLSTQARDIKLLSEVYKVVFIKLYNFFPRTPHVEALVVLEKIED
jgi:hypothetical protein